MSPAAVPLAVLVAGLVVLLCLSAFSLGART